MKFPASSARFKLVYTGYFHRRSQGGNHNVRFTKISPTNDFKVDTANSHPFLSRQAPKTITPQAQTLPLPNTRNTDDYRRENYTEG